MSSVLVSTLLHAVLAAVPIGEPSFTDAPALHLQLGGAEGVALPSLVLELLGAADVESPQPLPIAPGPEPAAAARTRQLQWWGSALRWSTAASLVVTSTLGTMVAINQPTVFGDGRCFTSEASPILGEYGCDRGLSTLHGASAVLSVTLYTANGVLRLAAPESRGTVAPGAEPVYRVLGWVHLVGIVVQPILGLVAAYPQVVGKPEVLPTDPFSRNLRTAHVFIGYVTAAAFLTTTILEH
jgi:hypothetical protein